MHDLELLLAERGAFVARLLIPVAFIFVVGIANDAFEADEASPPVMELVDLDRSGLSSFLLDYVAERAVGVTLFRADRDEADYRGRLEQGQTDVALVVPDGFARAAGAGGGAATAGLVFARSDPQFASKLEPLVESAGQRVSMLLRAGEAARSLTSEEYADAAAELARTRARELLAVDRVTVAHDRVALPARYPLSGFRQSVPGMGSMFVMLSVLAGASILVEERKRWTLQRTLTTPISHAGFVAGKILGRFLIGMAQYLVAIATALVIGTLFSVDFGRSPLLMMTVMAAFVLAVSALSILLATLVTREQQASGLTTLLVLTLAPLGGAWWSLDIEIIPNVMRQIAVVSPFYWVMQGFRAAVYDLGFARAVLPLGVLLGIALVAGSVATARMRWAGSRA
jgi:ABC-2 type transport system permease protein